MINNTKRFDGLAAAYDCHRPTYPAALFERIIARAPAESPVVVDVAAGTGISTALLLETIPAAWRIIAVEPGADMRRILGTRFENTPRVEIINSPAEALDIQDNGVGVITTCAAFHWFDAERFLTEARRILMPGGTLAVVNNIRVAQPVIRAFDTFLFQGDKAQMSAISDRPRRQAAVLRDVVGFEGFEETTIRWSRSMTARDLIAVWLTRSFVKPVIAKLGRDRVEAELSEIYRAHLGETPMVLDYDAVAFTVLKSDR